MMRPIPKPQGRLEWNGGISELLIFFHSLFHNALAHAQIKTLAQTAKFRR